MKLTKKNIFIVITIGTILLFFGYNSYQSIKNQNSKFPKYIKRDNFIKKQNTTTSLQLKPILKYSSTSNDLENESIILKRNDELSFHTFDFNTNTITVELEKSDNTWDTWVFDFISFERLANGIIEYKIDNKACHLIWVTNFGTIGYEFNNRQKLVFYETKQVE